MRKIRIIEHISLDGVIQAPTAISPQRLARPIGPRWRSILRRDGGSFDLLLGRRTYDTGRASGLRRRGLGPDIVAGVRRIKAMDGPQLIVWGSSTLTPVLLEHELAG